MVSTAVMLACLVVLAFCGIWLLFNRGPDAEESPAPDALREPEAADPSNCAPYVSAVESVFESFFKQHGFKPLGTVTCFYKDLRDGGWMCVWFYESPQCRFKFDHGGGSISLGVGKLDAPLNGIYEDEGWHSIHSLVPPRSTKGSGIDWTRGDESDAKQLLWLIGDAYPRLLEAMDKAPQTTAHTPG